MSNSREPQHLGRSSSDDQQTPIPAGFRAGVITAITVILGFSLLFLRSWAFELPGAWTTFSVSAGVLLLVSILLQLVALWRALQPKDEVAMEYRLTLRWFLVAIVVLLVSLVAAAISYSEHIDF